MGKEIPVWKRIEVALHQLRALEQELPSLRIQVSGIIRLLEDVTKELKFADRPIKRRTGDKTRYVIETVNERTMLAEYRAVGRPLRVDEQLFGAVIAALDSATNPLAFDDIADGVQKTLGLRPVVWQTRVVLRFLHNANLLQRRRSRYLPTTRKTFAATARRLWRLNKSE